MNTVTMSDESLHDAAMMNAAIDDSMVDLFGEAASGLAVSLPQIPIPGTLLLRIAEMQSSGCCTKLAWSKTGIIAQISSDGLQLLPRAMVRNRKTGKWSFPESTKQPIEAPDGRRWAHVQFGGNGTELAAVDDGGQVHLYQSSGTLERMHPFPMEAAHDESSRNNLDTVVGLRWLASSTDLKAQHIDAATKVGDRWEIGAPRHRDPTNSRIQHPSEGRLALLHVSRATKLTLTYQNESQTWLSTSVLLETINSSQEVLSHAAIGDHGTHIVVATHDLSSRLRLYKVSINWNATQPTPRQQNGPPPTTLVAPSLEVAHLTTVDNARAENDDTAVLTSIYFMPAVQSDLHTTAMPTTILAVFVHASLASDSLQPQGSMSVIARWHVKSDKPTLHESFKRMKTGVDVSSLNEITTLVRQADLVTNKVIMTVGLQAMETLVVLGASDATAEFRDRATMNSLESYGDASQVSSLPQCGFEYVGKDHNPHVALSVDSSSLAVMDFDGKLDVNSMVFRYGWQVLTDSMNDNKPLIEAGAVCIARQYAVTCFMLSPADDPLMLLPSNVAPETRRTVVETAHRFLDQSMDITFANPQKHPLVMQDQFLARALGVQLALGTDPQTGKRNFSAQIAIVALSLRSIFTAILMGMRGASARPQLMPATLISLSGQVRWAIDLYVSIVDTLVSAGQAKQEGQDVQQLFQRMGSRSNAIFFHLLLGSVSRTMIRLSLTVLAKYIEMTNRLLPQLPPLERLELQAIADVAAQMPFKFSQMETLTGDYDKLVRDHYSQINISSERRLEIELGMMLDDAIPIELASTIDTLLLQILPKISETIDKGKLLFWDTHTLALTSNRPLPDGMHVDVLRKTPLTKNMALRTCRRCGSQTEDIAPDRLRELPPWVASPLRSCVCLGFWTVT